ncbi:unnamed protein product [Rotaria sp. Silwood2]|nr:unnamed protein product [Rotaria sp. Silwood2]
MLTWTCTGSGKSGLYNNYYRHRDNCNYCTPEFEKERQKKLEEKEVAIQQHFQVLDDTNRRTPHEPQQHYKLIVDSTFIAIPEPHDSEQRKAYYYAKSPTNYAIKVQIACDFRHRIVHVSECYHGSIHDITVLRESGLLEHVEESIQIIGDKGYIGEEYVVTPRKKPHGRELTQEDKDFNRDINSAKAAIENINQRLKTYAILGGVYRGPVDNFHKITKIIQVIAALCNLNLNKHPIRR